MVKVGDTVKYVDEHRVSFNALVTCVFGEPDSNPSINVVFVVGNPDEEDPYGRQIARTTSLVHKSNQAAHGMYWC